VNNNETLEIALFPIPNQVTFPNSAVPLHVFEPRYRKMINDCIENKMRIGVCHIQKVLHAVAKKESLEEALKSNQSTYEPQWVFSAGFCELKETTEDGRLLVEIKTDRRYLRKKRLQEVPYQVYACEPYIDEDSDPKEGEAYRQKLDRFLLKFAQNQKDQRLLDFLQADQWLDLTEEQYSFKFFQIFQFDPDISQEILELKSVAKRLDFACRLLSL
jgi:Lon protease-like protein